MDGTDDRKGEITCLKIIVVGDPSVGKTSFIKKFTSGIFEEKVSPTIGCDFSVKKLPKKDGRQLKLQLWDIAGTFDPSFYSR